MPRRSILLPVLALLLLVPSEGAPAPRPLRVAHLATLTQAPVLIARERKLFEEAVAPRPVTWRVFPAGPRLIEALFAGEVDLGYVGPGPAVNGYVRSNGEALRIVSGLVQGGAGLVARRGSGFTDPARLAHRRIATPQIGNTQDIALRHWIRTYGERSTDEGGSVEVLPMPGAEQLTLFLRGELDGAWAVEPWLSRLLLEGNGELLLDESEAWPGGVYATSLLIARPGLLETDRALIARWVDAQERLLTEMNADPVAARDEANAALKALTGKGLPPRALESAWSRLRFTSDPARAAIEEGARRAAALGFLGPHGAEFVTPHRLDGLFSLVAPDSALRATPW